jgi:glycosyltransferase involved in cell wall biosynthesis
MTPTLSIIVPVYNEAGYLPEALPNLIAAVEEVATDYEFLVAENGSTDDTAAVARLVAGEAPVKVLSLPDPDYGAAMRRGFLDARGDWVVNFDIDYFSADFLRTVLSQPADVDLVIGSKRDPNSEDRRPLLRRFATRVFNLLLKVIL